MDENSIIITPQFYIYCDKSKTGAYEYLAYDFDLIVPNWISCDELMEAVKCGIKNKTTSEMRESVVKNIYDKHYCYTVNLQLDDESSLACSSLTKEQAIEMYSKYTKEELFAICNFIFNECHDTYKQDVLRFQESEEVDLTQEKQKKSFIFSRRLFQRHKNVEDSSTEDNITEDYINSIGISSVNPLKFKTNDLLSCTHNDQIWLNQLSCGSKSLKELGFMSSTRIIFDAYSKHGGRFLFSEDETSLSAFKDDIPEYNISDRPLYELDTEPVNIIPPTDPPKWSRQNLFAAFLSPLLMMGSMLVVRLFSSSGTGFGFRNTILMSGTMIAATMIMGIVNYIVQKKSHEKAVEDWKTEYQNYIRVLIEEIKARQKSDTLKLHELFPPVYEADYSDIKIGGLIEKTIQLNGDIFGRSRKHPDFLKVRIGTAERSSKLVRSVFEIKGEKKDALFSTGKYKNISNGKGKHCFFITLDAKAKNTDGALVDLPFDIARRYSYLGDFYGEKEVRVPVTLDMKTCGTLGIVRQKNKFDDRDLVQSLLDNIILDLCFHHNPSDLQICMFFDETDDWIKRQRLVNKFKHLPHFRELLGGFVAVNYKDGDDLNEISQFVFDKSSAGRVFDRVLEIITLRKADEKAERYPNIIMIFIDDYHFKSHQLSECLYDIQADDEMRDDFGLSFVFCVEHFDKLPKYCGHVIELGVNQEREENRLKIDGKCSMRLMPHVRNLENEKRYENGDAYYSYPELSISGQYSLVSDMLSPTTDNKDDKIRRDNYYRAYKILSALFYFRIAQGAGVPSLVELIKLHGSYKELVECAVEKDVSNDYLSISEEATEEAKEKAKKEARLRICNDVISTRTELIEHIKNQKAKNDITKSLAVSIGCKSDNELVKLDLHERHDGPHMLVAGTTGSGKSEAIVTYLIGLCMCYTPEEVNLLLVDMKGGDFIRRIGSLPHVVGTVSDIDTVSDSEDIDGDNTEYMLSRFLRSMKAEIKRRKKLFKELNVKDIDEYIKAQKKHSGKKKLPHLFLVVDEFTELMQFSEDNPNIDFKKEISSLARIGRSLGFHIILISQNIEGAITDNIRVNSRARLCLKVATKEASKEMIGSEAAADPLMPGFGRGFLYVGNGARSDYFQAAYSGASAIINSKQRILIPLVEKSGNFSVFYNSYLDNDEARKEKEKADRVGSQIEWLANFACELSKDFVNNSEDLPHQVLRPLLKSTISSEGGVSI